jgi:hypothetical protein
MTVSLTAISAGPPVQGRAKVKKYLLVFPLSVIVACAGTGTGGRISSKTAAVVNEECGENCSRDETVIKADTVVSKTISLDKRLSANIKRVKKGMPLAELVALVGPADCDCGCGIHILVYVMKNKACYHVGTDNEKVVFVRRVKAKQIN